VLKTFNTGSTKHFFFLNFRGTPVQGKTKNKNKTKNNNNNNNKKPSQLRLRFVVNCLHLLSPAEQGQEFRVIKGCAFYFCSRLLLTGAQKRYFEKLSIYCDRYAEQIPVTFVLGKYRSHAECSHTAVSVR
jgi:hypothetical protein